MGTILDDRGKKLLRDLSKSTYTLSVKQQPERARLCSYKEENETIDRRPVDPPPVVELKSDEVPLERLVESSSFFIRATIVSATPIKIPFPDHGLPSVLEPYYQAVKTPTGADATTGEVVQTPEQLRLLDGKPGALCIFAKLSVRVPGVFRLMFTLYDTTDDGLVELARTISEPFEVFSPKLFKGMHESTALTRHLAAQGVKVKLRTDTSVGRQSISRKRTPAKSASGSNLSVDRPSTTNSSISPLNQGFPSTSSPATRRSPLDRSRSSSVQRASRQSALTSTSSLVWRPSMENKSYGQDPLDDYHQAAAPGPGPSTLKRRRFQDDGLIPSLMEINSKYNFTPAPPATDLAAFSLSRTSTVNSPNYHSTSRQPSPTLEYRRSPPNLSSQVSAYARAPLPENQSKKRSSSSSSVSNINSPFSLNSRSTQSSSSSIVPSPLPRMQTGLGDDGIPRLPLPSIFAPFNSPHTHPHSHSHSHSHHHGNAQSTAPFIPPSVDQVLDRHDNRSPASPVYTTSGYMPYGFRSSSSPHMVTTPGFYDGAGPPRSGSDGQESPYRRMDAASAGLPPVRPFEGEERYHDWR
ncbi:uncharacterized protein I206_107733 [Kwoniella pini CBS 10737]|uniref:Velvet domain-containing protein n=1 Tax=Kwoniella pini CBS 10737 TaxID=1296096 RepID=A0A1B9HY46_9TREE|nr:uncharacterized protein I206_06067 [Kwoniella pini CBS 10737]OCF48199.1 hypothetical protein I206_06067 [Kwoniella pini CBS 10737]